MGEGCGLSVPTGDVKRLWERGAGTECLHRGRKEAMGEGCGLSVPTGDVKRLWERGVG